MTKPAGGIAEFIAGAAVILRDRDRVLSSDQKINQSKRLAFNLRVTLPRPLPALRSDLRLALAFGANRLQPCGAWCEKEWSLEAVIIFFGRQKTAYEIWPRHGCAEPDRRAC